MLVQHLVSVRKILLIFSFKSIFSWFPLLLSNLTSGILGHSLRWEIVIISIVVFQSYFLPSVNLAYDSPLVCFFNTSLDYHSLQWTHEPIYCSLYNQYKFYNNTWKYPLFFLRKMTLSNWKKNLTYPSRLISKFSLENYESTRNWWFFFFNFFFLVFSHKQTWL